MILGNIHSGSFWDKQTCFASYRLCEPQVLTSLSLSLALCKMEEINLAVLTKAFDYKWQQYNWN